MIEVGGEAAITFFVEIYFLVIGGFSLIVSIYFGV